MYVEEYRELKKLRELLWLNHGCDGLYGDDGEMQCGKCLIDFCRDSVEEIQRKLEDRHIRTFAGELEDASQPENTMDGGEACGCRYISAFCTSECVYTTCKHYTPRN